MSGTDPGGPARGAVVLVVSGPGGVGKGTVVGRLVADDPSLYVNRSWTTRERREGEAADAYHFATREEFQHRVEAGGFLEWVEFLDYLQGSPVPEPSAGQDVVFEIDVVGGGRIKELYPDALLVFIDAPDRSVQEQRLRGRGDDPARIAQRLARADEEAARAQELGYRVVVNDDLDRAVGEVRSLVDDARHSAAPR